MNRKIKMVKKIKALVKEEFSYKKLLAIFAVIYLFFLYSCSSPPSTGNIPARTQQQTTSQTAQPTPVYYSGDGGKGITLAVLEPAGRGLSQTEQWMLSMVQSSITGDFQRFSAMTIFDRQNLERILDEQRQSLSGDFSDTDYVRIGQLTNARFILAGSITKTASAYMLELAVTDLESGERRASYPPTAVSLLALENLSAVKEATAELLRQLGVNLTEQGRQVLNSQANIAHVQAETALARGIAAQRQGTFVEALSYFIQASNYDAGLEEAANRMNILAANISSGNIGADIRNDIAWRRQWVAQLQEAETFFANALKDPQPFYIVYSTDIRQGRIDYQRETIDLSIWMGFYPDFAWANQINGVISAVKNGLQATGRAQIWELDWPARAISAPSPFANQTRNLTSVAVVEIINDQGRSIGRQTVRAPYGFESRDSVITPLWQWEGDVSFTAVDANLITDRLEIRITSIDGIAAENAARQKRISVMPQAEWRELLRLNPATNRNIETARQEAEAEQQRTYIGHTGFVNSVAFSPLYGTQILSGSSDITIKLWDIATGSEIRTFSGHTSGVNSVAFSPDGRQIISSSNDRTIKLWDTATGREIRTFSGHTGSVQSVAFSPDGRQILSGSNDRTIKLWDVATGREIRTFSGHTSGVNSVAFSPDGRQIISGSNDRTIKLWDVATGREITFSGGGHTGTVDSVAFSPDGKQILSGSNDRTIKLWDAATGREIRTFSGHTSDVNSVAFSPDGRQIISGSSDRTIKLWDVATGREVRIFSGGHTGAVNSVAFSPDGRQILSGSYDRTIKLWDIATGRIL